MKIRITRIRRNANIRHNTDVRKKNKKVVFVQKNTHNLQHDGVSAKLFLVRKRQRSITNPYGFSARERNECGRTTLYAHYIWFGGVVIVNTPPTTAPGRNEKPYRVNKQTRTD